MAAFKDTQSIWEAVSDAPREKTQAEAEPLNSTVHLHPRFLHWARDGHPGITAGTSAKARNLREKQMWPPQNLKAFILVHLPCTEVLDREELKSSPLK